MIELIGFAFTSGSIGNNPAAQLNFAFAAICPHSESNLIYDEQAIHADVVFLGTNAGLVGFEFLEWGGYCQ